MVAPHAGAWIETDPPLFRGAICPSPLMQGRGLKHAGGLADAEQHESPLMQGRGLKPMLACHIVSTADVAPHAGAWIETHDLKVGTYD